jgi:hypothetical protein
MGELFKDWPRFNGAASWALLSPEHRAEIGAIALKLIVAGHGEDMYFTGLSAV